MSSTSPAVRGLVTEHYAIVHRAALSSGMSEADAKDLTQSVCETALRRLSKYDQGRPFPAWILGITYQIVRNFRKVQHRAQRIFDRDKQPADVDPSAHLGPTTPEDALTRKEEIAIAVEVIGRLPPELQTVFLMAEAEKLRQEDIAARLGLPKTTVAERLRMAWNIIDRTIHRRRVADLLAAILAAGISSLIAARAQAQMLARHMRIAGRRLALHVATVCAIGMVPMYGAALPASYSALSQAPERAVQVPTPNQGALIGARGGILSAVQAPSRPAEHTRPETARPAERTGVTHARSKPEGAYGGIASRHPAEQANRSPAPPVEGFGEKLCGAQSAKPDRCESPAEAQPSKLAGELMLLQPVRSALRAGHIALARKQLQAYDAQYPQGILRKERDQLAAKIAAYMDR